MGITLYTSRIVLETLGVDDFGIYNIVGGVVIMIGFINGAMSSATQRYLSYEIGQEDSVKLKEVFNTAITIHIIIAIILVVLAETFGLWFVNNKMVIIEDRILAANWVYQFSILTFVVNVLSVPYNALIISHEKMTVFAYVTILDVILKLAAAYCLLWIKTDKLVLYAILIFIVSFIIRICYQVYCSRKFKESKYNFVWNFQIAKQMFTFTGWTSFGSIAYVAKFQGVNMVLNLFYGTTVNAAWAIAQQVNTAMMILTNNFTVALNPPLTKAYAQGDMSNTFTLLFSGMKYSFFLSALLITPILFNTDYILYVWLIDSPENTSVFIQLSMIVLLIDATMYPLNAAVNATGKIKLYQLIVGTLSFINLPASYIALKLGASSYSVLYIAITIAIIAVVIRLIVLKKIMPFPISRLYTVLRTVIVLSIVIMIGYICRSYFDNSIGTLICSSIVSTLTLSLIMFHLCLNINEKAIVCNQINAILSKIKR
jgi:O-antigen/teichoic acid export membrane protein